MVAAAKLRKAQEHGSDVHGKIQDIVSKLVKVQMFLTNLCMLMKEFNLLLMIIVVQTEVYVVDLTIIYLKKLKRFQPFRDNKTLGLITIGKSYCSLFRKRYSIISSHLGFFDNLEYNTTSEIMSSAIEYFLGKNMMGIYCL